MNRRHYKFMLSILALLSLFGCGNTNISGYVFLTSDEGEITPVAGNEVILLHGESALVIKEINQKMERWIDEQSKISALNKLKEEEKLLLKQSNNIGVTRSKNHSSKPVISIKKLNEKLSLLKEVEKTSEARVSDLLPILERKFDEHMTLLTTTYLKSNVSYKSSQQHQIFDELCIEVKNKGNLNVTGVTLYVSYNDERVENDVVERFWEPRETRYNSDGNRVVLFPEIDFQRHNTYKENMYGLAPEESQSYCLRWNAFLYLSGQTQREAEKVGLNEKSTPRSGKWQVHIDSISLSSGKRVSKKIGWSDAHVFDSTLPVFKDELSSASKQWAESIELSQLSKKIENIKKQIAVVEEQLKASTSMRAHASKVDHLQNDLVKIRRKIKLIEEGADNPPEILMSERRRILKSQEYRDMATGHFQKVILAQSIRSTHSSIDGSYQFNEIDKGSYVIYTRYEIAGKLKSLWFTKIEADGSVKVDMSNYNMKTRIEDIYM